jgi:hypothetical protein
MSVDEPQSLLIALYVRDACGLRPEVAPAIPSLEPVVPVSGIASPEAVPASAQWVDWWQQLLEGGGFWPEHRSPSDFPKLFKDPEIQRLFYWPALNQPPEYAGLAEASELQVLVRQYHEAARAWSEARKHEFAELTAARQPVESEVVNIVERKLGRNAHAFEFDIRVLPVAGLRAWRQSSRRALITRALFSDRVAYREWLQPIIEELA